MNKNPTILIVAGEVSGDMHGAALVKEIRKIRPDISFFGIGGKNMRSAGVETLYNATQMAVMGITEVLLKYSFFRRVFNDLLKQVEIRSPDAAILVDYPGFNLKLADELHAMNIKTIYYVCPQVWAWHRSRIKLMATILDQLITIFPFEKKYFDSTKLKVEFAGHPLTSRMPSAEDVAATKIPWRGKPRIALLPGSRLHEIQRILPIMWDTALRVEKEQPDASFIIAAPSSKIEKIIRHELSMLGDGPAKCSVVTDKTREILGQADAAIVASGTATIETSLMLCPMIITYKTSALTYFLGRMFIKINHIGMVNILAGREICPEFVQWKATPKTLTKAIMPLLNDSEERRTMLAALKNVNESLGTGNASLNAAKIVIKTLDR